MITSKLRELFLFGHMGRGGGVGEGGGWTWADNLFANLQDFCAVWSKVIPPLPFLMSSADDLAKTFSPACSRDRLVGPAARRPPRERKIPGSNPACAGIFSGSSHTSDLKTGTPVATLPGAWRYRVSAGTGQPGVSIL